MPGADRRGGSSRRNAAEHGRTPGVRSLQLLGPPCFVYLCDRTRGRERGVDERFSGASHAGTARGGCLGISPYTRIFYCQRDLYGGRKSGGSYTGRCESELKELTARSALRI